MPVYCNSQRNHIVQSLECRHRVQKIVNPAPSVPDPHTVPRRCTSRPGTSSGRAATSRGIAGGTDVGTPAATSPSLRPPPRQGTPRTPTTDRKATWRPASRTPGDVVDGEHPRPVAGRRLPWQHDMGWRYRSRRDTTASDGGGGPACAHARASEAGPHGS